MKTIETIVNLLGVSITVKTEQKTIEDYEKQMADVGIWSANHSTKD